MQLYMQVNKYISDTLLKQFVIFNIEKWMGCKTETNLLLLQMYSGL